MGFERFNCTNDIVTVSEGVWNVIATDGQSFKTASVVGGQLRVDGRQLIPDVLEITKLSESTAFTTIEYDVPSDQNVVIRYLTFEDNC